MAIIIPMMHAHNLHFPPVTQVSDEDSGGSNFSELTDVPMLTTRKYVIRNSVGWIKVQKKYTHQTAVSLRDGLQ